MGLLFLPFRATLKIITKNSLTGWKKLRHFLTCKSVQ